MFEVASRSVFPYSTVTYITVQWPDGTRSSGSGVVVGPNDVLTAMHVVFNSDRGGWASELAIYPGADTKPVLKAPFGVFGDESWRINSRASNWDVDGDGLLVDSEAQFDLALVGLSERIGDLTGWLGTRNDRSDGAATMLGYPGRGTGLMAESVFADASSRWGVFDIDSGLGAGASGGPLIRTNADGSTYVVGVLSSGNTSHTSSSYAALFGQGTWDWFTRVLASNDDLIGSSSGTDGAGVGGKGLVAPLALAKAYLAYFGRPVDYAGLTFFAGKADAQVAAAFDASAESQALYGQSLVGKVNAIYKNLFNREAEAGGLQHWTATVAAGRVSAPEAALTILNGAQGSDALAVQNKLAAADAFSRALDTPAEQAGYAGLGAAQSARSFVAAVGASAVSLQAALGRVDAAVASAVASSSAAGAPREATFDDASELSLVGCTDFSAAWSDFPCGP